MRRQQEVRNPLPHVVLVPAVPADELPLHHLSLHEERVQLLEHGLVALQVLRGWRLGGELWEAQLFRTRWGQPQVRLVYGVLSQCLESKGEIVTSVDVVLSAAQSRRGRTLMRNCGLTSTSSCASSASLGCSGKDADEDLQVLTAQLRKFMLRTFILTDLDLFNSFYECRGLC